MSFFYLSAVKGDMSLHLIETITNNRLEYLESILKRKDAVFNEYVVEGSVYDNVGHFMVCIISILGDNIEFTQFILKAEIELFKKRLSSLAAYDMRCFAKKLLRYVKKLEFYPFYIDPLIILCQHLILKNLAHHLCSIHSKECDKYNMKLNFKHCLRFISKREVELKHGTALLPCGKWKQYLVTLFYENLKHRLDRKDCDMLLKSDPRLSGLLQKISHDFFPQIRKGCTLLSKDIDNQSKHFPPCMLNLHRNLRYKHRLSHTQRFYYSLFLKDIGLPVEEAVQFWRAEYRKSPNGTHSCCHNWDKDEKKYLYGIRHMYGLEGARKNYTSYNCQRIQSLDNACTEGGCPFKTFDSSNMVPLLENPSEELLSKINEYKKHKQYNNACMYYLKTVRSLDCDNFSFNFTPIMFYTLASKCIDS